MYVYRISQTRYASSLVAPGIAGRWNSFGQKVLYTGGTLALSCLEVLVHRSGASIAAGDFSTAIINIEEAVKIEEITIDELVKQDPQWFLVENYVTTQAIGDRWLTSGTSAILKVPSAIIDLEHNYLINPNHPDFSKVHIAKVTKFTFDRRLMVSGDL
jgi:RES domain-containing protein